MGFGLRQTAAQLGGALPDPFSGQVMPWLPWRYSARLLEQRRPWGSESGISRILAQDGDILVLGGGLGAEVWSSSNGGATWAHVGTAPWPARQFHTAVVLVVRVTVAVDA